MAPRLPAHPNPAGKRQWRRDANGSMKPDLTKGSPSSRSMTGAIPKATKAPRVTVIRGKAAEAEMAAMERAAKRQQQSKGKRS